MILFLKITIVQHSRISIDSKSVLFLYLSCADDGYWVILFSMKYGNIAYPINNEY